MKVSVRDFKRRDGAVYVEFAEVSDTRENERARLQSVGEIGVMIAGALIALAWLTIL